jgi:hypothetical protein
MCANIWEAFSERNKKKGIFFYKTNHVSENTYGMRKRGGGSGTMNDRIERYMK